MPLRCLVELIGGWDVGLAFMYFGYELFPRLFWIVGFYLFLLRDVFVLLYLRCVGGCA